jgi:hypothetical protein
MTRTLKHFANNCQGNDRPDCPIIEEITNARDVNMTDGPARFGVSSLR